MRLLIVVVARLALDTAKGSKMAQRAVNIDHPWPTSTTSPFALYDDRNRRKDNASFAYLR